MKKAMLTTDNSPLKTEVHNAASQKTGETPFQEIFNQWLSPIYRYFYARTGNVQDAEDLTSQLFLKAFRAYDGRIHEEYLGAWLFTIARNLTVDHYRANAERPLPINPERIEAGDDLKAQFSAEEERTQLQNLISSLPPAELDLIRLRFAARLSYREIGKILKRSEDATRKAVSRLLEKIRKQIEDNNGNE